ncbi:uncharacterized protein ISCGN_021685 [Ixodes scapularis]
MSCECESINGHAPRHLQEQKRTQRRHRQSVRRCAEQASLLWLAGDCCAAGQVSERASCSSAAGGSGPGGVPPSAPGRRKPAPLLRARTLPAIVTPSLCIIQAQLDAGQQQGTAMTQHRQPRHAKKKQQADSCKGSPDKADASPPSARLLARRSPSGGTLRTRSTQDTSALFERPAFAFELQILLEEQTTKVPGQGGRVPAFGQASCASQSFRGHPEDAVDAGHFSAQREQQRRLLLVWDPVFERPASAFELQILLEEQTTK